MRVKLVDESNVNMRRVIRIGEKSVGITLPREWLNTLKMSVGTLVKISLLGNSIVISPLESKEISEKEINIKVDEYPSPEMLSKILIASYLEGLDKVNATGDRIIIRRAFNEIFSKLPGIVLLESGERSEFRITVDENIMGISSIIKTLISSSLMMFDLLEKYFTTGERSFLDQLLVLDDDLDRLHFMGIRLVKKSSLMNIAEATDLLIMIKSLEHVGDSLDRTARFLLRTSLNEECMKISLEIFRKVREYYNKTLEAYVSKNVISALDLLNKRAPLMDELISDIMKTRCSNELSGVLHEALNITAIAAEIAELSTSAVIREKIQSYATTSK